MKEMMMTFCERKMQSDPKRLTDNDDADDDNEEERLSFLFTFVLIRSL